MRGISAILIFLLSELAFGGWKIRQQALTKDLEVGVRSNGQIVVDGYAESRAEQFDVLLAEQADSLSQINSLNPFKRLGAQKRWEAATRGISFIEGEKAAEWIISRDLKLQHLFSFAFWAHRMQLQKGYVPRSEQWKIDQASGYFEQNKRDILAVLAEYDFHGHLKEFPQTLSSDEVRKLRMRISAFLEGFAKGLRQKLPTDFEDQLRFVHQLINKIKEVEDGRSCNLLVLETAELAR